MHATQKQAGHNMEGRKTQQGPDLLGAGPNADLAQAGLPVAGAPAATQAPERGKGPLPRPKWLDMLSPSLESQQGNSNAAIPPSAPHAPPPADQPSPEALRQRDNSTERQVASIAGLEQEQVEAAAGLVMMCSDSPSSVLLTAGVLPAALPCACTPGGQADSRPALKDSSTAPAAVQAVPMSTPASARRTPKAPGAAPSSACLSPKACATSPRRQLATAATSTRGDEAHGVSTAAAAAAGGATKRRAKSGPQSRTSPYIGVSQIRPSGSSSKSKRAGRWEAHIWDSSENNGKGRQLHLGSFNTAIQAAKVYDRVALVLRGPLTELNFPASSYDEDPHIEGLQQLPKRELVLAVRKIQDEPEEQAAIAAEAKARQEHADRAADRAAQRAALKHPGFAIRNMHNPDGEGTSEAAEDDSAGHTESHEDATDNQTLEHRLAQVQAAAGQDTAAARVLRRSSRTVVTASRAACKRAVAIKAEHEPEVAAVGPQHDKSISAPIQPATDAVVIKAEPAEQAGATTQHGVQRVKPEPTTGVKRSSTSQLQSARKRVQLKVRQVSVPIAEMKVPSASLIRQKVPKHEADAADVPNRIAACPVKTPAAQQSMQTGSAYKAPLKKPKTDALAASSKHHHGQQQQAPAGPSKLKASAPAQTSRNSSGTVHLVTPKAQIRWGHGKGHLSLKQLVESSQCAAADQGLLQAASRPHLCKGAVSQADDAQDAAGLRAAQQPQQQQGLSAATAKGVAPAADMTPMQLHTPAAVVNNVAPKPQAQPAAATVAQSACVNGSGPSGVLAAECSTPAAVSRHGPDSTAHTPRGFVGSPSWFPTFGTPISPALPSLTPQGQPAMQRNRGLLTTSPMRCWLEDEDEEDGMVPGLGLLGNEAQQGGTSLAATPTNSMLSPGLMLRQRPFPFSCKQEETEDGVWRSNSDGAAGLMMMSPPADPAGRLRSAFADGHMTGVPMMAMPHPAPGTVLLHPQGFLQPVAFPAGYSDILNLQGSPAFLPWNVTGPAVILQQSQPPHQQLQYNGVASFASHTGVIGPVGPGIVLSPR